MNILKLIKKKKIEINVNGLILDSREVENDQIITDIKINKIIYKGLVFLKSDFCLVPKRGDYMKILRIEIKYDESFLFKMFASGIILNNYNTIILNGEETIIDLSCQHLLNTLKNQININENLMSKIFYVKNKKNSFHTLISLDDCEIYNAIFNNKEIINNDFILICNYYFQEKEIRLTNLSFIYKLTEENLFILLERIFNENQIKVCKVFDLDVNGNVYLCDKFKNLLKLEKLEADKINQIFCFKKNNEIKLCQLCFISNFEIESNDIKINNKSLIYFSSQDIYFSDKIILNYFSIIQFHFLDFNDNLYENEYNKIEINQIEKEINKKEINFVISSRKLKNQEYYPIIITLINRKENGKKKTFKFILFQGFLNKINAFINYSCEDCFFYEYFIYNINEKNLINCNKKIIIDNSVKVICIYDTFLSSNRIRFNILNVPFQLYPNKELFENENSFQICEMFEFPKSKIVGIYSINEMDNSMLELSENNIFNNYYENFSEIFKEFYSNNNFENIDNHIKSILFLSKLRYTKSKIDKINSETLKNFNDKITLSQFKTRVGFIICHYISKLCNYNINHSKNIIKNIYDIIQDYKRNEKVLSLHDSLRIIFYKLRNKLLEEKECKLYFFSMLNNNSPYLLAKELNIKEIENITEQSKFFLGYLQLDSFILKNYFFKKEKSYSLSMEPIFILKRHLLNNYEDFFFIDKNGDDNYARQTIDENLTIINEKKLFSSDFLVKNIIEMNDILKSRNYAVPISMELRNEKNGHMEKSQKNNDKDSPILYLKNVNIEKIIYEEKDGVQKGESGKMIESFIDSDPYTIKELKLVKIYGEILDYKYFIGNNFDDLKKKMNEIKKNNPNNEELINFQKYYSFDKEKEKIDIKLSLIKQYEELGIIIKGDVYYTKAGIENYKKLKIRKNFFKLPKEIEENIEKKK